MNRLPDHDAETRALPAPAPATTNVMLSGRRLGRYLVGTRLGAGGMGSVWNAYDESLNRHVAIKVLAAHNWDSEDARQRLLREARAAALLDHPNIEMIYDVGELDGAPWIAIQHVSGMTMHETMIDERIRVERAVTWVAALADALDHAHARGVLHRDVSPRNVTIDPQDRPILIDFGLAEATCMPHKTESGRVVGTIHYLAPERMEDAEPDPRSDIYSLGIVLYQLLSGTLPFPAEPPGRYLTAALRDPPIDVRIVAPGISESLASATMLAIERDPSRRFQNADTFREVLATHPGVTIQRRHRTPPHRPLAEGDRQQRYERALSDLQRSDLEGSLDATIDTLAALAEEVSDEARFHAMLAIALVARSYLVHDPRDLERARAASNRADGLDNSAAESLTARAEVLRSDGMHEQSIAAYQAAIAARPDMVEAYLGLSLEFEALSDRDSAEDAARRAIAAKPSDWRGYRRLGGCLYNAGAYARAAEPWRRAIELVPDNARQLSAYGSILFRLNRLEEALEIYRRSMSIRPNGHAAGNVATALFYLGRPDEAVELFERAVAEAPDDARLWGNLGSAARLTKGCEARAAEALDRAIHLMRGVLARNESIARNWGWLATWLAARGLASEAQAAIDRAMALGPRDVDCIVIAGTVAEFGGDRRRAVKQLIAAVRAGYGIERLARDPFLAPLRNSPEWRLIEEAAAAGRTESSVTLPEGGRRHDKAEGAEGS